MENPVCSQESWSPFATNVISDDRILNYVIHNVASWAELRSSQALYRMHTSGSCLAWLSPDPLTVLSTSKKYLPNTWITKRQRAVGAAVPAVSFCLRPSYYVLSPCPHRVWSASPTTIHCLTLELPTFLCLQICVSLTFPYIRSDLQM